MAETIEREYGFLKIGNKYYEQQDAKEKISFVEVSKGKVKKKIKLLKEITEKLKDNLDKEAVLMEALSKIDSPSLEIIHSTVYNSKRKVKIETRKHYCVDMRVGKITIPIVD
jgi:IS30 family transposase